MVAFLRLVLPVSVNETGDAERVVDNAVNERPVESMVHFPHGHGFNAPLRYWPHTHIKERVCTRTHTQTIFVIRQAYNF